MKRAFYYTAVIFWCLGILFWSVIASSQSFFQGNALIEKVTTTATAAGTTTLTKDSQTNQVFTGATTQTVVLPDATTLPTGRRFYISNQSTGAVTVNTNGGSGLVVVYPSTSRSVRLYANGSAAGTWNIEYDHFPFTPNAGAVMFSTASIISVGPQGTAGQYLRSNGSSPPTWSAVSISGEITGVLPLANGGTNLANVANAGGVAFSTASEISLGPVGTSGYVLTSGGSSAPAWISRVPLANGGTNNNITATNGGVIYSTASVISVTGAGSSGQFLKSTGAGAPNFAAITLSGDVSGVLPEANGGTNQSTYATGDTLYASASNTLSKRTIGATKTALTVSGGVPVWDTTITSDNGGTNMRMEWARITADAACSIASDISMSSNWISTCTRNTTASYTLGMSWAEVPTCNVSVARSLDNTRYSVSAWITAISKTSITIQWAANDDQQATIAAAIAVVDDSGGFHLQCIGPR